MAWALPSPSRQRTGWHGSTTARPSSQRRRSLASTRCPPPVGGCAVERVVRFFWGGILCNSLSFPDQISAAIWGYPKLKLAWFPSHSGHLHSATSHWKAFFFPPQIRALRLCSLALNMNQEGLEHFLPHQARSGGIGQTAHRLCSNSSCASLRR